MKLYRILSITILVALLLAACAGPAATPAPTNPPPATNAPVATTAPTEVMAATSPVATAEATTAAPTTAATEAATVAATGPAVSGTPVATIPADKLVQKGKLLICTDFPYPPQEFYDENGNPQGSDVEIGNEIAKRLGLEPVYVNSVFDTIIAAVTGGKCDIVISAQNITPDRQKQVSMIPYFEAGQAFVALKGNPENINTPLDLCGKSAAAESGTTEADYLQGTGSTYEGKGLVQQCKNAGKPEVKVVVTSKDTDALQQLQAGKVAIYDTDSPVAAYYTVQHPDQFQLVGQVLEPIPEGISVPCGQQDCTNAPLTEVGQAVKTTLMSMMTDGTYAQILKKWNMSDSAVTLK